MVKSEQKLVKWGKVRKVSKVSKSKLKLKWVKASKSELKLDKVHFYAKSLSSGL